MGSNVYIADGRQLSGDILRILKTERNVDPNQPYERKSVIDSLYLVGKRHAVNLEIDKLIASGELGKLTAEEVASLTKGNINFTLTMSRSIFDALDGKVALYFTGAPHDIPTVASLRERMLTPGYKVLEMPNITL